MIRKLKSGQYRLYSRKPNPQTGKRRNLGTFDSRAAADASSTSAVGRLVARRRGSDSFAAAGLGLGNLIGPISLMRVTSFARTN